jgi:hypothetical protein
MFSLSETFPIILRMRNVSKSFLYKNQNTRFKFNNVFFRKSCLVWDMRYVEKYCSAGQDTDDNRMHAQQLLHRRATILRLYLHWTSLF